MMPVDHFLSMNNKKCRVWEPEAEPRQCAIYQDEQEGEVENELREDSAVDD